MIDPAILEGIKLAAQLFFMLSNAANLTEEEKKEVLNEERIRFYKNIGTPLPEV